jgi:membrane fusion protein, multidrug efflux system
MKTKIYLLPAAIIAIFFASCNNQSSSSRSEVEIPVKVTEVTKSSIHQSIESNGTVKPTGEVELKTESEGNYKLHTNPSTGRPFKLGDRVKKGSTIIELVNEEYVNGIRIETQKLNLEIAQNEYEKQKSLYEKGGVTLRELRNAEVSFMNSKYDYDKAAMQLQKLRIASPFDGVIVSLPYFTPGVKVSSGTVAVKLMDYQNLVLNIELPEKYLTTVYTGQNAKITNYNLIGDTLIATVSQLSPAINENSRTFQGVLTVSNPDLKFRPGMFVKAEIITEQKDSAIVVPREIIKRGRRGDVVYVVDKNTAVEKQVVKGIESNDMVEIIRGLEVGDRLVTEGYEMLSNRSKVKIRN